MLDTNFLFNLFGLEGQFAESVAKGAVQFTKELGMQILVHRVSIREFRRSLESQRRLLKTFPMPSQELASAMAESLICNSPLGAYYRRYAATRVSWEDWVQPFLAIESRLSEFDIEVTNMYQDEIEADKRLAEEANRIYDISHGYYEKMWGRPLSLEVCKHDAFLSLFIRKIRDGKPEEFVQAKAWCVTRDGKLPRYERTERHRLGNIPVFILVEHWINFARPIIPRTEDWDTLARSLLLRPFLRSPLGGPVSIEKIHRAASRIAEYRNYTPQLACRVLLNARLQEAVRTMPEAEFEEKVTNVVEEALLDEFYQQEGQLELVQSEKEQLQEQITKRGEEEDSLRKDLNEVKNELATQSAQGRKILATVMGAFLVTAAITIATSLDWDKPQPLLFGIAVIGLITGILTIVGTVRSWRVAWRIFLGISAIASLLAAIVALCLWI